MTGRQGVEERWRLQAVSTFIDAHPALLFPAPAVIVLSAVMILPLLYNLFMSLHEWYLTNPGGPQFIGLRNYAEIFVKDENFRQSIWRTLYFTALATTIEMALGLGIALLLNRQFKGHQVVRTLFMLPLMATPTAMALMWVLMYNPTLGVLNYLLGLVGVPPQEWLSNVHLVIPSLVVVDVWQNTPFVVLVLLAGLSSLPVAPYESARIDGAGTWQLFWNITLPLLRPAIMVAVLFRVIDTLKTFDTIYVMTQGGPGRASETINLFAFRSGFVNLHMGYASAVSVTLAMMVFMVSAILIRMRRLAE